MKEQLISFETAKSAKEKGFDSIYVSYAYTKDKELIRCGITNAWIDSDSDKFGYNYVSIAPTQSLLQKWLRDEHGVDIIILLANTNRHCYIGEIWQTIKNKPVHSLNLSDSDTYEEALEKGLQEALKLI